MKRKPALWTMAFPEQFEKKVTKGWNRFWKRSGQKPPIKVESCRHRAYRMAAKEYLKDHPFCCAKWMAKGSTRYRFICTIARYRQRATQIHHIAGKAGPLLLDQSHWLAVCPQCHRKIHDHPKEAERMGNLDPSGWRHTPRRP